jgi:hypothetical protein
MPSDSAPLLHDLSLALIKVAGVVIALAIVYPLIATAIANSLK